MLRRIFHLSAADILHFSHSFSSCNESEFYLNPISSMLNSLLDTKKTICCLTYFGPLIKSSSRLVADIELSVVTSRVIFRLGGKKVDGVCCSFCIIFIFDAAKMGDVSSANEAPSRTDA